MADPLASSHYSIEHAKRHIRELERELAAWVHSEPAAGVVETNAQRTEDSYKIKLTKPLPVAVPGIAFDTLCNLRSALDQAGHAVALAAGKSGNDAHFPFGDTLAEVQGRIKGRSKDIPKEVFDVMVALQPYETGNVSLWALNKLCNTNKHEIIIPIGMATGNSRIDQALFGKVKSFRWPPRWDTAKNEMEIVRVPHGETPHYDLTVQMLVVIGQVKGVGGQPAVDVLNAMRGEVERSVMAIEGEARRIGFFKS